MLAKYQFFTLIPMLLATGCAGNAQRIRSDLHGGSKVTGAPVFQVASQRSKPVRVVDSATTNPSALQLVRHVAVASPVAIDTIGRIELSANTAVPSTAYSNRADGTGDVRSSTSLDAMSMDQDMAVVREAAASVEGPYALPNSPLILNAVPVNLPSVLAAIDNRHPIVGRARWQVQQAYAQLDQDRVLWLPSVQDGFSFHRNDGNYQASNAAIVDVNRNSFQYGLGTGATGAGTTPRPGFVARFHLADAIFSPRVAERGAWARSHAANATMNDQLLAAAAAYIDLLDAHQELRISELSRQRLAELTNITVDAAEAGQGLMADADRMRTELAASEIGLISAQRRAESAAAQLARAMSLEVDGVIVPTDVNAVPLDLTSPAADKSSLIETALHTRSELKEVQALVAEACEAYRREKLAPLVPSVLLGFSASGFGGGVGSNLNDIDGRYDLDALLAWEIRNLGFGEKAARREQTARVQQLRFEKIRAMDEVALQVSESFAGVQHGQRQISVAQSAIQYAEDSYRRNLERIREGQGLPLEVLQSLQALEQAQRSYLRVVTDYNQAQMRLQWSLGFPISA